MTHLIPIHPGTPVSRCRSCHQPMYWAPHPVTGKQHPVSVKHAEAVEPTGIEYGQGISHFADCPNAEQHRRTKPPVQP